MRRRACLALALVVVGLLVSHPGRVAARTVLLMPEVFPDAPVRPLLWVSSPPRHEEYAYTSAAGQVDCDLYLPQGGGRHGTVILYTGAFGLRRAPAFVQFAEALARSGAVVLVPESTALRAGDIRAEEVDTLLQAVSYLRARPEVDPSRVGIFGFSAGGSLVLLAAETELGRQQIAFVNIFGAYYDAGDLLRQVAEDRIEADGGSEDWEPDPITRYAVARQVVGALADPRDREILSALVIDQNAEVSADPSELTAEGQLVFELFQRPGPERVEAILGALPPNSADRLAAVSPRPGVGQLRAHLYLMHDRSDHFIPYTHSRQLAAEAPAGTLRRYTEFDLFGHVMPNRQLDPPTFAREVAKLVWLAVDLGQEFL